MGQPLVGDGQNISQRLETTPPQAGSGSPYVSIAAAAYTPGAPGQLFRADGARASGVPEMQLAYAQSPALQGDRPKGDATTMPNAFQAAGLNAKYGDHVAKTDSSELLEQGKQSQVNYVNDPKADIVLKADGSVIVNKDLSQGALKQYSVFVEPMPPDTAAARKQALESAVQHIPTGKAFDPESLDPEGGNRTPPNTDGGGCDGGGCNGGGGGHGGGGRGGDNNELNPNNNKDPNTDPNDLNPDGSRKHPTVNDSKAAEVLSKLLPAGVEQVFQGGANLGGAAYGAWLNSALTVGVRNMLANMSPEDRAKWLAEHPDLADALEMEKMSSEDKAKYLKDHPDKADLMGTLAKKSPNDISKFLSENPSLGDGLSEKAKVHPELAELAASFKNPSPEFAKALGAFAKAYSASGNIDESTIKSLIPSGAQKLIAKEGLEASVKKLANKPEDLADPAKVAKLMNDAVAKLQTDAVFARQVYSKSLESSSSTTSDSSKRAQSVRMNIPM